MRPRSANEWRSFWRHGGEQELEALLREAWQPLRGAGAVAVEAAAQRIALLLGSAAPARALAAELGRIRAGLGAGPDGDGDACRGCRRPRMVRDAKAGGRGIVRFVTTDADYLAAARAGAPRLGHRQHVRLAWLVIRDEGAAAGGDRVARMLRELAELQGEGDKYHETLTRFWIHLVAHAIEVEPGIDDFDVFVERFPLLLDGSIVRRHWSAETLESARTAWVEPDVLALP